MCQDTTLVARVLASEIQMWGSKTLIPESAKLFIKGFKSVNGPWPLELGVFRSMTPSEKTMSILLYRSYETPFRMEYYENYL